ncbi:MAG: hypothetical protein JWM42_3256 [Burkholderia sp.]|jgi:hypothetical protein|nr:hypothetical protein [Burkholderia sp.]
MTERVEWEVVDGPAPGKKSTPQQLFKNMLGPWWRWKIAAVATVAAVVLVLFVTLAGVVLLSLAAIGILAVALGKFLKWMRRSQGTTSMVNRSRD